VFALFDLIWRIGQLTFQPYNQGTLGNLQDLYFEHTRSNPNSKTPQPQQTKHQRGLRLIPVYDVLVLEFWRWGAGCVRIVAAPYNQGTLGNLQDLYFEHTRSNPNSKTPQPQQCSFPGLRLIPVYDVLVLEFWRWGAGCVRIVAAGEGP
jgi:hypothetical protein